MNNIFDTNEFFGFGLTIQYPVHIYTDASLSGSEECLSDVTSLI